MGPKKQKIEPHTEEIEQLDNFPLASLAHTSTSKGFLAIENTLCDKLMGLEYGVKVQYVYNPVDYAGEIHEDFVLRFCRGRKKVLVLGMNPGPWGMGQTGVSVPS